MTFKEKQQLKKAYNKTLAHLQKSFFKDNSAGLLLFAEYLRYLRDCTILTATEAEPDLKIYTATIIAAVAEFDAYRHSTDHQQKSFHWNNFCELVKQNMEDWLIINDSVKKNNCT